MHAIAIWRPPSDLDHCLDCLNPLESGKSCGMSVRVFCLQGRVPSSLFYRSLGQRKHSVPEELVAEKKSREQAESGQALRQRGVFAVRPTGDSPLTMVFTERQSHGFHDNLVLIPTSSELLGRRRFRHIGRSSASLYSLGFCKVQSVDCPVPNVCIGSHEDPFSRVPCSVFRVPCCSTICRPTSYVERCARRPRCPC